MGGFLYVKKPAGSGPASTLEAIRRRFRGALARLAAKELAPGPVVDGDGYVLFLFRKRLAAGEQLVTFPNGDFAAAVGTLLYRGKCGAEALRLLHRDFGAPGLFAELYGSYAVLLRKNGALSCFNDYFGTYHVYADEHAGVVSSSFLAVLQTLPRLALCEQAVYEYVFDGAIYGTDTLARGVRRLNPAYVHDLHPWPRRAAAKSFPFDPAGLPASFDAQVDAANAELVAYFRALRAAFGERMLLGLSGGYDSRLLLAAALQAGAAPRLFVGGPAGAADVRLAQEVAAQAGLPLAHLDSAALPATPVEKFAAAVRRKLEHYDGAGIRGVINDGEELAWRRTRLAEPLVELNGGGGEIFRDFWKLPDRPIAVRDFVARVLEFKNLDKIAAAGPRFDRGAYRERLARKLGEALHSSAERMSRAQVASLYTVLRSAAFAGPSNKELNLLAWGLLPFAEPRLALPSYAVPLRSKVYGRFEAEMIRRLNPALAALPTSYGHSFSAPAPLARRARESLDRHCRGLLPLPLIFAAYRRLRKANQYNSAPRYYARPYLDTLFDLKRLRVAEYFDPARVGALDDPYALSRLLTVELLLLQRDDASLDRKAHQPGHVADPQLLHQPRAVGLHRLLG